MQKEYQQCSKSVLDNIADPNITFDENGVSNYYYDFQKGKEAIKEGEEGRRALEQAVEQIKKDGKGKAYDCIVGLSGGVDSSYVAYLAHQYGLRPLTVHFDNGWNSELAVMNIQNIVSKCDFDLHTLVVDWEEFRDIQLSYLKASVVDIEVPTDHAIGATLVKLALKHDVKYMLSGSNVNTECIMPQNWIYGKGDQVNLMDIHKKFGSKKIKTFPLHTTALKKRAILAGIQQLNILNYVDYNKKGAKETIAKELAWRDYGGKHYESLFTKFYQAYILPEKFKIDKRKAHLSNLIFSGEITKEEALEELKQPLYKEEEFKQERDFFLKKFDLTLEEWEKIMAKPRVEHTEFDTERPLHERYKVLAPFKFIYQSLFKLVSK